MSAVRERALSTAVTYVLTLGMTAVLVSGLLIASGGAVEDRRDSVTRSQLTVIGEQLAADVEAADRLARADADRVAVESPLPERVADGGYRVHVAVEGRNVTLRLTTDAATVRVPVANETPVRAATLSGDDVEVRLVGGALEVRRT